MKNNNYNYQNYNDSLLRMEKNSSNKAGLIIMVILVLALIAGSAYYFYQNGISFEFRLPWQTEKEIIRQKEKKNEEEKEKIKNEYDDPVFSDTLIEQNFGYTISFTNFRKSKLGYDFDLTFEAKSKNYTFTLEKVLVDGYDTSPSFTHELNSQESFTQTVRIPQAELDALDIIAFRKITIYIKSVEKEEDGETKVEGYDVLSSALKLADNSRIGLIEIDRKNQTIINYYKSDEDKDNTYIYFDFRNYGASRTQLVSVKKLLINGEVYEYKELNEEVYHGAEKIISLTIPKKEVKKVNSFSVAFTMLNEENGKKTAAYITNAYSKSL